jgi:hypothetical protein
MGPSVQSAGGETLHVCAAAHASPQSGFHVEHGSVTTRKTAIG